MRRPKLLRNYTPPSFDDMAAALPDTDRAELARFYRLMCLAMKCKAYDRSEALERLRGIADHQRATDALLAQLRTEAEAQQCLLGFDHGYNDWQAGAPSCTDDRRA